MYKNQPSFWSRISLLFAVFAIVCFGLLKAPGESTKTWQPGTLLAVKSHTSSVENGGASKQYDVTIQVGNKIYVASHTQKDGEPDLEYYIGMSRMVLIDGDMLTFNDLLGHSHTLRVLSSKDAPEPEAK